MLFEDVAARTVVTTHDLGYVHAALEDRRVARHWRTKRGVTRLREMIRRDEGVARRAEVVTRIAVTVHTVAEATIWRQRCPADVIAALTPRHPCWSPFAARHPHPAVVRQVHPATVVIHDPAKGLVRLPHPAQRRPAPTAIQIRAPARCRDRRAPAVAVAAHIEPAAMGRKLIVKERVIVRRCHWHRRRHV